VLEAAAGGEFDHRAEDPPSRVAAGGVLPIAAMIGASAASRSLCRMAIGSGA
jgi:hypothetical protein